jgi:nucleoside-diphosphate kinase
VAREADGGGGGGGSGGGSGGAGGGGASAVESTCFIVLPSAVANGQAGAILSEAQERLSSQGLAVTAARLATFTRSQADEFLEVYKQVVPECVEMVNELSRGPFVALEVTGAGAVQRVRDLCGPRDIEVAKRVRAASLRAKFGASAGASGVHCTDLVQDAPLETEFVFQLTA